MRYVNSFFVLLLGAALATFIWSNYEQKVTVYFTSYRSTGEISLSLAMFASMLVGFLLASILAIGSQLSLRRRGRQLRRKNERLDSELAELRKLPLTESLPEAATASDETSSST